jgi:adenosylmethionine-8-amino-7-oxononanoate aminotransferase
MGHSKAFELSSAWSGSRLPALEYVFFTTRGRLEQVIALHDAPTTIELVAWSTGVLVPTKADLEQIPAICDRDGVLLMLDDEVRPSQRPFAPDLIGAVMTLAKSVTSGVVPMAGAPARRPIVGTPSDVYKGLA